MFEVVFSAGGDLKLGESNNEICLIYGFWLIKFVLSPSYAKSFLESLSAENEPKCRLIFPEIVLTFAFGVEIFSNADLLTDLSR